MVTAQIILTEIFLSHKLTYMIYIYIYIYIHFSNGNVSHKNSLKISYIVDHNGKNEFFLIIQVNLF